MSPHECRPSRTCSCSVQALEPDEDCPIHGGGGGEHPRRCATCGRWLREDHPEEIATNEDDHP